MLSLGHVIGRVLRYWLPGVVAATILTGLVYVALQQTLRLGANDPQIQMAEDTAAALAAGGEARTLVPTQAVDIGRSLAPFLIVFDRDGRVVASSASLDGATPALPAGVLDATRPRGENRLTWQPRPGVRLATVITVVNGGTGGYVLAGRSLREVESRIDLLGLQVGLAWLALVVATLVVSVMVTLLSGLRQPAPLPSA
ncbi:MAG: hypothetical protein KIT87_23450 [Anaerolineae bacterium]|nr:hypothetical protein [Anaerolineae bacterium]